MLESKRNLLRCKSFLWYPGVFLKVYKMYLNHEYSMDSIIRPGFSKISRLVWFSCTEAFKTWDKPGPNVFTTPITTQPDWTLFFLKFSYLWGKSLWSFRNYGSNVATYHILKPETNKGDFRHYFELFKKKFIGGAITQKYQKQIQKSWYPHYGCASRDPRDVKKSAIIHLTSSWRFGAYWV